jgi:mono/diheme cytochrome c family protein
MRGKFATFLVAVGFVARAADNGKTILDGVYSSDQAARGQAAYTASCSACHLDDLTAYRGALHGIAFVENFQGDSVDSLFRVTKNTMPRDAPASLRDESYLDIIAYILQVNFYPSGGEELKMDALKSIWIVGKSGPEAPPNFALVAVIGCLEQGPGDKLDAHPRDRTGQNEESGRAALGRVDGLHGGAAGNPDVPALGDHLFSARFS